MSLVTDLLDSCRRVAVVGASPDPARYGHEVLEAFRTAGYQTFPVNPKYDRLDGQVCFRTLAEMPERADVVVFVVSPENARRLLPEVPATGAAGVWLPPGTADEATVNATRSLGLAVVDDVCPVATLRRLHPKG